MPSSLAVTVFRVLPRPVGMFLVRRSTPKFTLGVQVLVRRPDGRILLVRQTYRDRPFLPGGALKRGENVAQGARRELAEETGLDLEGVDLGHPQVVPRASWVTFFVLVEVDEPTAETAHPRGAEISGLLWAHPGELPDVDPGVRAALRQVMTGTASLAAAAGTAAAETAAPGAAGTGAAGTVARAGPASAAPAAAGTAQASAGIQAEIVVAGGAPGQAVEVSTTPAAGQGSAGPAGPDWDREPADRPRRWARWRRRRVFGVSALVAVLVLAVVVVLGTVLPLLLIGGSPTRIAVPPVPRSPTPSPTGPPGSAIGSVPVPAGFPSASTTGVPAGTRLTARQGGLTINKPGTVVTGMLITGCVTVKASDVTIENTKIVCDSKQPGLRVVGTATHVTVTNVEIDGGGLAPAGLEGRNFVATRVNIHGSGDGAHLGGGTTVQDSYIHDLAHQPNIHHDDLQTVSGTKGSNIRVLHNTLQDYSAVFNGNSSYHLGAGDLSNILVEDNYMDGGSYTIQVDDGPNQKNIVFTHNQFGRHYRFGLITETLKGTAVSFTANTWQNDGQAATEAGAAAGATGSKKKPASSARPSPSTPQ